MTSYDEQTITYDSIGNPLTYRNGISFSWTNGRELASYIKSGVTTNYTYNDSGIRTSKKIGNNAETNYYLNGSSIVRQVTGDKILDFFYDENGNLYGFKEAGDMYYYVRNGQSDIIGILDSTGLLIASYVYDSWGNLVNKNDIILGTVAYDNPFRYRGYYFDSDTELYYLNSRYYDTSVGRFINADGLVDRRTMTSHNLYSYCTNNPVIYTDSSGQYFEIIGLALRYITLGYQIYNGLETGSITAHDLAKDIVNYSKNNSDIDIVKDAKVFSSINGTFVIKQDIVTSCQYGNTIYLDKYSSTSTINHEYGHSVQEKMIGTYEYTFRIAIPSVIYYNIDKETNLPEFLYFSMPWERSADYFGGVDRGENYYFPGSLNYSLNYLK
jgi:RHS repeat-associated protein